MTPEGILAYGRLNAPRPLTQKLSDSANMSRMESIKTQQAQEDLDASRYRMSLAQQAQQHLPGAVAGNRDALMQLYAVAPDQAKSIQDAIQTFNQNDLEIAGRNAQMMLANIERMSDQEFASTYQIDKGVAKLQAQAILQSVSKPMSSQGKAVVDYRAGYLNEAQMNEATRKQPLVEIQPSAFNPNSPEYQSTYQKQWEKSEADSDSAFYSTVNQGVQSASAADYRAARLEANINQGLETGAAQPALFAMKAWAKDLLGVEFENIGSAQEVQKLALDAAMQELQSFKGPTTDFEFGVALEKVGNLGTDPEAFRRYIQLVRRTGQRAREIAQVVEDYRMSPTDANGVHKGVNSLRGVQGHVTRWRIDNPLVYTLPPGVDPHQWVQGLPAGALFMNPSDGRFLIKRGQ